MNSALGSVTQLMTSSNVSVNYSVLFCISTYLPTVMNNL